MSTASSVEVRQIKLRYDELVESGKDGFEVVLFMDCFAGRFRVMTLDHLEEGGMVEAEVIDPGDKNKRAFLLFRPGQAIWYFSAIPAAGERAPVGFGRAVEPR